MDQSKKRDIKTTTKEQAENKEPKELEKKHRMGLNFNMYVGDDTGLVKKVRMIYSYQTDIVGSYMKDESFKQPEDGEINQENEEKRKMMQEDYSKLT